MNRSRLTFNPGPGKLYPSVAQHMQAALEQGVCEISHRSDRFIEIYRSTVAALRELLNIPDKSEVLFVSSATEAMERLIQGVVGRHSLHLVNGAFSKRFFLIAQELGKRAQQYDAELGTGFDLSNIVVPEGVELCCVTHNETSTGVMHSMQHIHQLAERCGDVPLALDVVSSLPCASVDFDKCAAVFFSIQKAFGLPAGLGVLVLKRSLLERAAELHRSGVRIGTYHSLLELSKRAVESQTPATPNVLAIYLLGKIARDFIALGWERVIQATERRAKMIYDYLEQHPNLSPAVRQKCYRSTTVIAVESKVPIQALNKSLSEHEITVGSGYREFRDSQFRIANFPAHTDADFERLYSALGSISQ